MAKEKLPAGIDVNTYIKDGFKHVADVVHCANGTWSYRNVDDFIMFDPHNSWVYFIVVGNKIVKVGESEKPLGIRYGGERGQPVPNSSCRFGGYRQGRSEQFIREALQDSEEVVSIWAKKCEIVEHKTIFAGKERLVKSYCHKTLEKEYINLIKNLTGSIPPLNKIRK